MGQETRKLTDYYNCFYEMPIVVARVGVRGV